MRYGSVCSGVESASLAWVPLGWECKFVAEVEPFPCAVLQERWGATRPINMLDLKEASNDKDKKLRESWVKQNSLLKKEGIIPNEGDFTKIGNKYEGKIDVLVGGTPCQDVSIAGKRAGFAGERSGLAFDFVRLAYESKVCYFVWENVPGTLSSAGGEDFATFLSMWVGRKVHVPRGGFKSAGFIRNDDPNRFGVAWRVLDMQYTRVSGFPLAIPQRRRRLFVVGCFGSWSRAATILLEPDQCEWVTPTRIRARENFTNFVCQDLGVADKELRLTKKDSGEDKKKGLTAYSIGNGMANSISSVPEVMQTLTCAHDPQAVICTEDQGGSIINVEKNEVCGTLRANSHNHEPIVTCFASGGFGEKVESEVASTLSTDHDNRITGNNAALVIESVELPDNIKTYAIAENTIGRKPENGGNGLGIQEDLAYTQTTTGVMGVSTSLARRIVPVEAEALMGFPKNYTRIPWKGKSEEECPDTPRYKCCGNSFGPNVIRWIGMRIELVDKWYKQKENKYGDVY